MTILPLASFPFPHANRPTRPTELRSAVARRHCLRAALARAAASRPAPARTFASLRAAPARAPSPPRGGPLVAIGEAGGAAPPGHLRFIIHGGAPPMAAVVLGEHRCHCAVSPFHHWGEPHRSLEHVVRAPPSPSAAARRRQGPGQASPSPRASCAPHAPLVLATRSGGLAPHLLQSSRRPPPPSAGAGACCSW
ncbi:hypothetical protein PVAP13_1NG327819 [Panicum virgatum]|uniref:Uncharacterized protein n=1 Tax=Panicum virgatum TaxID=38727 RepID=A0A8T0WZJ7_PANVG|nr:hypothetical protein PVAP13_1NG327819 [Panicum virgatum]